MIGLFICSTVAYSRYSNKIYWINNGSIVFYLLILLSWNWTQFQMSCAAVAVLRSSNNGWMAHINRNSKGECKRWKENGSFPYKMFAQIVHVVLKNIGTDSALKWNWLNQMMQFANLVLGLSDYSVKAPLTIIPVVGPREVCCFTIHRRTIHHDAYCMHYRIASADILMGSHTSWIKVSLLRVHAIFSKIFNFQTRISHTRCTLTIWWRSYDYDLRFMMKNGIILHRKKKRPAIWMLRIGVVKKELHKC